MQKEAAQGCFHAEEGYGHTYPKIKESFRLERNLGSLQPNVCSKQDQLLNLDPIAEGHVQSGLEKFQGWRFPSFSGYQIPELGHPHRFVFFFSLQPGSGRKGPGLAVLSTACPMFKDKICCW